MSMNEATKIAKQLEAEGWSACALSARHLLESFAATSADCTADELCAAIAEIPNNARPRLDRTQCCTVALAIIAEAVAYISDPESPAAVTALALLVGARLDVRDCHDGRMSGIACAAALEWNIPGKLDIGSAHVLWHARDAIRACVSIMEVSQ